MHSQILLYFRNRGCGRKNMIGMKLCNWNVSIGDIKEVFGRCLDLFIKFPGIHITNSIVMIVCGFFLKIFQQSFTHLPKLRLISWFYGRENILYKAHLTLLFGNVSELQINGSYLFSKIHLSFYPKSYQKQKKNILRVHL